MKGFVILVVFLLLALDAHAETVVLNNSNSNSSGVKIVAGGWSATGASGGPLHADATYNAFSKVRNGALGQYDFYYSLEVVPQFDNQYSNCGTQPNLGNILKSLFGTTKGALIVVKVDVQYRWTTGIEVDFLKNDAGLVVAGLGPSQTQAQAGFGCYFDTTLRPTFPLLQYGGGGANDRYDDFVMKFIVIGGGAQNLNLVSNVVSLFSDISAAAGWAAITTGLAGPGSLGIQKAAQNFQTALQTAGTLQNQVSVGYTLKANGGPNDGKLSISIPDLFSGDQNNGDLVIYVRRTGSIALANSNPSITLASVFDNPALANRQCNPTDIASGNCNGTVKVPLRVALATILKGVDSALSDGTSPIAKLIDINDAKRSSNTYNICKGIRTAAREYLHLSTLDEMLIRWAFTKEGGLQDALNAGSADPTGAEATALAKKTGADSFSALSDMCWNSGDQHTLEAIAKELKKTIAN